MGRAVGVVAMMGRAAVLVTSLALAAHAGADDGAGQRTDPAPRPAAARRALARLELAPTTAPARVTPAADRTTALLHELLGDAQRARGRNAAALESYRRALDAGGESAELAKKMASSSRRLMRWGDAAAGYREALRIAPDDGEARDDLRDMRLSRGVQLRLWGGGWELDRSQRGVAALVSYGGLDRSEVYAGYARSDQVFYETRRLYGQYYFHYAPESYVKLEGSWKTYDYPADPAVAQPNPDSTAYRVVPAGEVELSHRLTRWASGSLAYQLFAPTLFHDPGTRAINHKASVGTELRPWRALRVVLLYSVLRDPDTSRTLIRGRTNPAVSPLPAASSRIVYRTSSLLGGGVGWAGGRWEAEVRYLPNRELDRSYSWSLLARVAVQVTRTLAVHLQHVYDRYSAVSAFAGSTANVALLGLDYRVLPSLSVGGGLKVFEGPLGTGVGGFGGITVRTGVGL